MKIPPEERKKTGGSAFSLFRTTQLSLNCCKSAADIVRFGLKMLQRPSTQLRNRGIKQRVFVFLLRQPFFKNQVVQQPLTQTIIIQKSYFFIFRLFLSSIFKISDRPNF